MYGNEKVGTQSLRPKVMVSTAKQEGVEAVCPVEKYDLERSSTAAPE